MKKRSLLTNIFVITLMVSIVFVLLAFFEIFPDNIQQPVLLVSMTLALLSVLLVDIVFPLLDNMERFKSETSYKVKTAAKVVLFIVAVVFLVLTVKSVGIFGKQFVGIALFCVAYLAQFFIDLDKNKNAQIEEDEEDEDEDEENSNVIAFDDEDEFDNSYDNEDEDIK
ncbi:MAG: hypothetical protein E7387_01145 [Ruminococcaceae bacterium]|nr:hypothetical protein [Oscillospiraceae bacterium]